MHGIEANDWSRINRTAPRRWNDGDPRRSKTIASRCIDQDDVSSRGERAGHHDFVPP
jgi:hypothetical protein